MKTTTTVIRGLAIDVLIVETVHADAVGTLFYRAEVLIRDRETGVQNLIRRTRVPGTGRALAHEVQQRGLRALDSLKVRASH